MFKAIRKGQKYHNIIISICLFLVFDASVLLMNFYISFQISEDAAGVNLAGRQRMLSQRMTKSLLQIQNASQADNAEAYKRAIEELSVTSKLFNDTLYAFDQGGEVTSAEGNKISIKPVSNRIARKNIDEAKALWQPYVTQINHFINTDNVNVTNANQKSLENLTGYALTHNLTLLKLMNNLTVELEHIADSKAKRLRIIQTVGILLALFNFFLIMFHFLKQLRESDAKIESARKETTEILDNVGTGLFLLDENLNIGGQYSKELEQIIGQNNLANQPFLNVLSGTISEKALRTTQKFIKQLYNPRVDEELVDDLNPLKKIAVNIEHQGEKQTRYLDYRFSRVYEDGVIRRILVNVADVSKAIELEKKLEKEREQSNQQLEMMSTLLNADNDLMMDFLNNTDARIKTINNTLKKSGSQDTELRKKLTLLYREMHTIKGESSALGLHTITNIAESFESSLQTLQKQSDLAGDDFLSLTVLLDQLIDTTKDIHQFSERINHIAKNDHDQTAKVALHFQKFIKKMAERNDKQIELVCDGFDMSILSDNQKSIIQEISTQLLRNAVVHGIEKPSVREQFGKSTAGQIKLMLSKNIYGIQLVVEDDGGGIDYDAIRKKALQMPQYSAKEVSSWNNQQLLEVLFSSGFSTMNTSNEDAGRGVGLDVIISHVKALKGVIKVDTRAQQFTRFSMTFPTNANMALTA